MSLFADAHRLVDAGFYCVWRVNAAHGDVVGVRITGELTDARNPIWRAHVDALCAKDGWPRFMVLDVRDAVPMASLPKRIQSALWGKAVLARVEHGVIVVGANARAGLTVRAILRVAGMTNVTIVSDDRAFAAALADVLDGRAPTPTTPTTSTTPTTPTTPPTA